MTATIDASDMELLAWVGPDEFDGSRGIKSALTRVGWVPLAFKGEHLDRATSDMMREELHRLATEHGTQIQLVRFHYVEVIETIEP
jgi:hypothetical protein